MSHEILFLVDGERETTHEHALTPNFIIQEFGKKDPSIHYLIELKGHNHEKESYEGRGDEPIRLHPHQRFQIISTGPTPVSDVGTSPLATFASGLEALGLQPAVDSANWRVTFDYPVLTGKFAGRTFRMGLEVPRDFPLTPPAGPHVEAVLHPTGQSGAHPTANVTDSGAFGPGWQYWSRPFPDWARSKKTVATYMSYIFRLWDTQ